jgi:uncharacterized protein (DUF4415 family)
MKTNYDFSKARRGAVLSAPGNKIRITIRLDKEVIAWFKSQVETMGEGNYQSLLNNALREFIKRQEEPLEKILRRVVRQELRAIH